MSFIFRMSKLRRNWEIKSSVVSLMISLSRLRNSLSARMMRKFFFIINVLVTLRLLVIMRKLLWLSSACVIVFGVVSISINSVELLGICFVILRAMRFFFSVWVVLRSCYGVLIELEGSVVSLWWRRIRFCFVSLLRSRRIVCGLTEKCFISFSVLI